MLAISARPSITSVARSLARRKRVDCSCRPITTNDQQRSRRSRPVEPAVARAMNAGRVAVQLLRADRGEPTDRRGRRRRPPPIRTCRPIGASGRRDDPPDDQHDFGRRAEPAEVGETAPNRVGSKKTAITSSAIRPGDARGDHDGRPHRLTAAPVLPWHDGDEVGEQHEQAGQRREALSGAIPRSRVRTRSGRHDMRMLWTTSAAEPTPTSRTGTSRCSQ